MTAVRPTLQLNFAKAKQLDPRIQFTRNTLASYTDAAGVLRWAKPNEPRFDHDPLTGECLGLLYEETRTNLLTYSDQFDNAAWTKTGLLGFGSGSVVNAVAAPDGTTTADLLVDDTTTTTHGVQRTVSFTAGASYTLSAFFKAKEKNFARLRIAAAAFSDAVVRSAEYDLTTGTLVSVSGTDAAGTITAVGGGWYRLTLTCIATLTASALVYCVSSVNSGTVFSYAGDGVSGVYIWGAQLEQASKPSSYIATTSAAVVRNQDEAVIPSTSFNGIWNPSEGTILVEARRFDKTSNRAIAAFADAGGSDSVQIYTWDQPWMYVYDNAVTQGLVGSSAIPADSWFTFVGRFKANDFRAGINSTLSAADTSGTLPTAIERLVIGATGFGGQRFFGHIGRITLFPRILDDATITELSRR